MRLFPPDYNIRWADGGSVNMLHHPNTMDTEEMALKKEVLQPEVYFLSLCLLIY